MSISYNFQEVKRKIKIIILKTLLYYFIISMYFRPKAECDGVRVSQVVGDERKRGP